MKQKTNTQLDYGKKKQGSNECPPLQEGWGGSDDDFHYWQGDDNGWPTAGGIAGGGNSGMDFVLGGDAGANDANVVALNITKTVVDTQGNLISLQKPMTNRFYVYRKDSLGSDGVTTTMANGNTVLDLHKNAYDAGQASRESAAYEGFNTQPLHPKDITVGEDSIGLIYDYDVTPGMYYITEDNSPEYLPRTVKDTDGRSWKYVRTYFKTEYVWREDGDSTSDRHVSREYTLSDTVYKSIPEVLGKYTDVTGRNFGSDGKPLRNGFLQFFVYNVYEPEKVNIEVEKQWIRDGETVAGPTSQNEKITVKLGRYKLVNDDEYTAKGTLTIRDSFEGITEDAYKATYTVTGPGGTEEYTFQQDLRGCASYAYTISGLWGGSYTVKKTVENVSGWSCETSTIETKHCELNAGGSAEVEFSTSRFTASLGQSVFVGVLVANNVQDNDLSPATVDYATGYYAPGTQLTFSYDVFHSSMWNRDVDAGWEIYHLVQGVQGDIPRWRTTGASYDHRAVNQTITVGNEPLCILIKHANRGETSLMNIRLYASGQTPQGASSGGSAPASSSQQGVGGSGSTTEITVGQFPPTPPEGKKYMPDSWTTTIELKGDAWTKTLMAPGSTTEAWALDEYDENGNAYVYYLVNVDETTLTTQPIECEKTYLKTTDDDGKIKFTFKLTNDMPASVDIGILKVAKNTTNPLTGASFNLYSYNETFTSRSENPVASVTVDGNGRANLTGLKPGYYELDESVCPAGYIKTSSNPRFKVTVDPATLALQVTLLNSNMVSYNSTNRTLTVENEPGARLPSTGGAGTTMFYLAGGLITLLALALLIARRRAD